MNDENSILQIIFETREDELANINANDKLFLKQNGRVNKRDYLDKQLDKIPYNLKWLRNKISNRLEDYIVSVDNECSYFCKKYYLIGLKDGIKLRNELEM